MKRETTSQEVEEESEEGNEKEMRAVHR